MNVNVCAWCVVRVDSVPFLRFMFLIWTVSWFVVSTFRHDPVYG